MPALPMFDPPGRLSDFDTIPNQRAAWDEFIDLTLDCNIDDVAREVAASQFYNPKKTLATLPEATKEISWIGFPRLIDAANPGDKRSAWKLAEIPVRGERPQDEYLEWFVTKQGGKVTRIDFTCEGPEYWEALAQGYPQIYTAPRASGGLGGTKKTNAAGDKNLLLSLYRKYISPQVQLIDLFDTRGNYNRHNKWNTTNGAMHLNQGNNTLGAEINIAAQATIKRIDAGRLLTGEDELILCARYGQAGRASDPHIGSEVNALARQGYSITLQNPVGLYIAGLPDASGWLTPDGANAVDFWTIARGTKYMILRATFEVPEGRNYVVGDIQIGGDPIEYGGQIADSMLVKLTGIAFGQGGTNNQPVSCNSPGGAVLSAFVPSPTRLKPPSRS